MIKCNIADVVSAKGRIGWKGLKISEYIDTGPTIVTGPQIQNERINWEECAHINEERYEESPEIMLKNEDILFTKDGTIGKIGWVRNCPVKATIASHIFLLRPKTDELASSFFYYLLQSPLIQWEIKARISGSVIPSLTQHDFLQIPIQLPNRQIQLTIGYILSTLDDLIQQNREINNTIKYIMMSIFKSWFIDFDPVEAKAEGRQPFGMDEETAALFPDSFEDSSLGPIPAGWKIGKMKDVTKVIGGGTPSTKNPDYWGGDICWTSPKDLSNIQGLILLETSKKITEKGLSKVSSGLLPSNTVLMSSRAPIGYLALTRIPMAINQGYIAFGQNKIFGPSYLLNWCKFNQSIIEAYAGGSTFPEISKSNFKEIQCIIPRVEILEKFETLCKPLFDQLEVNARTIKSLEDTRDALLPRLMSGELSVEGLED